MIREPKNVDFCTTGRHLTEADFTKISEWINQQKTKKAGKVVKPKPGTVFVGNKVKSIAIDAIKPGRKSYKPKKENVHALH